MASTRGASGAVLPPPEKMPRHVAIIMDGNGRWAKERGKPRSFGHAQGTENLRDVIRASDEWGVKSLTVYAFSTENWKRPPDEVSFLMQLLLRYFNSEIDELDRKNVRIRILGDITAFAPPIRACLEKAMDRTRENTGLFLNIALNYGGRAEIVRAARSLAERCARGELDPAAIDERLFEGELYTAGQDDVDLLIRTSGEMRVSNFLPWQTAYAEFVVTDLYWPDFDRAAYAKAIRDYAGRSRRFGNVMTDREA